MDTPTSGMVFVTPEQAERWISTSNFEHQRRIAPWQVKRLAIEMERGRFIAGTQIHFGVLNGTLKLLNGQHTLSAIARYGKPVALTVLYTPCTMAEELGELYARHDQHRKRTPHDSFVAMGLSEELNLPDMHIVTLGGAVRWINSAFRRVSVLTDVESATSPELSATAMREYGDAARRYFDAVSIAAAAMQTKFKRVPVVAVGVATFHHAPERAYEFWRNTAMDDQLRRDDPRKALHNFLIGYSSKAGDQLSYIRHVASCWNAFMDGRALQFVRPTDAGKIGVTIRGTPFRSGESGAEVVKKVKARTAQASRPEGTAGERLV